MCSTLTWRYFLFQKGTAPSNPKWNPNFCHLKKAKRNVAGQQPFHYVQSTHTRDFWLWVADRQDIDLTETEFPSQEVGLCSVGGHSFFCGLKLVRAWLLLHEPLSTRLCFCCLLPSISIHTLFLFQFLMETGMRTLTPKKSKREYILPFVWL